MIEENGDDMSDEKNDEAAWRALCQDNAEALKRAVGRERVLKDALKSKDDAHREVVAGLRAEAQRLTEERDEARRGILGTEMVLKSEYDAVVARLEKVTAKLEATKRFAEEQRLAATDIARRDTETLRREAPVLEED